MKKPTPSKGFLLLVAIVIIGIVALVAAGVALMYARSTESGSRYLSARQATYVAESGIQRAGYQFLERQAPCSAGMTSAACCQAINANNVALANGRYNLTAQYYQPATFAHVSAAIPATGAISQITLDANAAAAGYAPNGKITIGSETFSYTSINGNNLLGVTRAVGNSTMQAHPADTSAEVIQTQCQIIAQAGVPDLTAATTSAGAKTITANVMAPEQRYLLYAVGNSAKLAQFTGTTWKTLNYPATSPYKIGTGNDIPDLNAVALTINGAEGFVVGNGHDTGDTTPCTGYDCQYENNWNHCAYCSPWCWPWPWCYWACLVYNWWGCYAQDPNYNNSNSGWVPIFYLNTSLWGSDTWQDKSVNLAGQGPIPSRLKTPLTLNSVANLGNGTAWAVGNRIKITSGYGDLEDEDDWREWWWFPGHHWHHHPGWYWHASKNYQYLIVKIQCTSGTCSVSPAYPGGTASQIVMPANDNTNGNLVSISMLTKSGTITGFAVDDYGNVLVYNNSNPNGRWDKVVWEAGTLVGTPLAAVFVISPTEAWISGNNGIWKITPSAQPGKWKFQATPIAIAINDIVSSIYMYDTAGTGTATDGWAFLSTTGQRLRYQNVNGTWKWTDQGTPAANHAFSTANTMLNTYYSWVVGDNSQGIGGAYYNGATWLENKVLPSGTNSYNGIAKAVTDNSFIAIP